jgi:hypothetical protein
MKPLWVFAFSKGVSSNCVWKVLLFRQAGDINPDKKNVLLLFYFVEWRRLELCF